jgi:tetratricopeptide (TPR) repeat protein
MPPRDRGKPTRGRTSSSGLIYLSVGRYKAAAVEDRYALFVFPDYAYALDALARAEAGLGHYRAAIQFEQQAVNRIPLPQYVSTLGDLYGATGRPGLARKQYELISVIQRLLVANGRQDRPRDRALQRRPRDQA